MKTFKPMEDFSLTVKDGLVIVQTTSERGLDLLEGLLARVSLEEEGEILKVIRELEEGS